MRRLVAAVWDSIPTHWQVRIWNVAPNLGWRLDRAANHADLLAPGRRRRDEVGEPLPIISILFGLLLVAITVTAGVTPPRSMAPEPSAVQVQPNDENGQVVAVQPTGAVP